MRKTRKESNASRAAQAAFLSSRRTLSRYEWLLTHNDDDDEP
jgi:hypothetical protein